MIQQMARRAVLRVPSACQHVTRGASPGGERRSLPSEAAAAEAAVDFSAARYVRVR